MCSSIEIIHIIKDLHASSGGPSRTVVQLSNALAKHPDIDVTLLSQSYVREPSVPSTGNGVKFCLIESRSRAGMLFGQPIRRELTRIIRHKCPTLIHSHGLWAPANHWASHAARRYNIPLIVQPRGMLEPWSLKHKMLKKRIAMAFFQRYDLETARLFIATAEMEFESIRKLGLPQPVAIIPNGIQVDRSPCPIPFVHSTQKKVRTVLFLSRVHPKKGIINLLNAWAEVSPHGWHLKLAGPNEKGHLEEVMSTAKRLGILQSIEYIGAIDDMCKSQIYDSADLFVLPTFSENFGVVVVEALAHGVPVITTHGAPWADLETYGCGWWVEIGAHPLAQALRQSMALSDEDRRKMGERGKAYVLRYNWDNIAKQTIEVYRWLLGQRPVPDCVRMD